MVILSFECRSCGLEMESVGAHKQTDTVVCPNCITRMICTAEQCAESVGVKHD